MKSFATLYQSLDRSTSLNDKRAAIVAYLSSAPPHDAAWALAILSGGKLARIANTTELRRWIGEETGHPDWLVEESHDHVGDLAETLTLLMPEPAGHDRRDRPLSWWIEDVLQPVAGAGHDQRRDAVVGAWRCLPEAQRLAFNKLLTGALRVGASQRLVQQAVAQWSGVDVARIAQRMLGGFTPGPDFMAALTASGETAGDREQPYPFYLASPLEGDPAQLGAVADWLLEWKWDGIRAQLIRRGGTVALWSRGEERLDGRFPEIEAAARALPDGLVLDGEVLGWSCDAPLPFLALQKRIHRRKPGPKLLGECPVAFLAYDLLEHQGEDLRGRPLTERRLLLERVVAGAPDPIHASPRVEAGNWEQAARLRQDARERAVEGLMLKRLDSPYRGGRRRGDWWKWKVDPLTIDAVLVYAQPGSGRRSTLFTDYTFALWDGDTLVPVAKAYSGLTDEEIARLDRWIRSHTLERFGPVRQVQPLHVFELGFEAVQPSARHKSGIAVRFPRILRWRDDKPVHEADRLDSLRALAQSPAVPTRRA